MIKLARKNSYNLIEEAFTLEKLQHADEAFITSTSHEITPIIQANGDIKATYAIGKRTKALQQLFSQYVEKSLKSTKK